MSNVIFTVTVIDDSQEDRPPYQRVIGIFESSRSASATLAVEANQANISESGNNKYAVIEKTFQNCVLPQPESKSWFEWDFTIGKYMRVEEPEKFSRVPSFGLN